MTILSIALGILLAITVTQLGLQANEIGELELDLMRIERRLEKSDAELQELRCEYERSLGGTSYRWRPVNRVFGGKPR